ncbi:MAG: ribonuclease P protein component [Pseudonocardiaceae bacterium]
MLPASTRLTRREDFAKAVRRGRRAARRTLVIHLARAGGDHPDEAHPKVGFVVGRAVGGAVVRHRVQRQLRHLMRTRLDALPTGALLVVRALPAAAGRDSAALAEDLDAALRRLRHSPADVPAGSRPAPCSSRPSRGGRR